MITICTKTDPQVMRAVGRMAGRGRGGEGAPVVFGNTVWHIGKTETGTLTPTKINTMAEFEQHFGPFTVEPALRLR